MNVYQAVVEILKREGTEFLSCFPANPLIDYAAAGDIRPILARTERTVINIADGFSRIHNGNRIGVCCMQAGPGIENAFAGVAQAYADSVPVLILPGQGGVSRTDVPPEFDASRNYQHVTKWVALINTPERAPEMLRRAYQMLRSGTPGPVMLELPSDVGSAEFGDSVDYEPVRPVRYGPDPADVNRAAELLLAAQRPVIQSGQGVLYAEATDELVELAELLQAPVMTTLPGKSSFPEDHPLSLGCGTYTGPAQVKHMLAQADCLFGVGTSFTRMFLSTPIPPGKTVIHAALDERDLNKDLVLDQALMGDAKLVLQALLTAIKARGTATEKDSAGEVRELRSAWEEEWGPKLNSDETPINPYRVIHDLQQAVDVSNTIVTADSGNPRDQISPFYMTCKPNTYIGWGKSTQLGYSLALAMGAKLAAPEKLCINVMGDAAIGMTGMDLETAARAGIAILTVVLNNGIMAAERDVLIVSDERYGAMTVGGNYAKVAEGLGVAAARVETPDAFIPALERGIAVTEGGAPFLIECMVKEGQSFSRY